MIMNVTVTAALITQDYPQSSLLFLNESNTQSTYVSTTTTGGTIMIETRGRNTPRGLISDETRDIIMEAINCYLLPVVFIFGMVGNTLSLIVLMCLIKAQTSTTVLLIGLTLSDTGFLITTFIRKVSCITSKLDPSRGFWLDILFLPQGFMLNRVFGLTTAYLTMVISVERFLACYLPFKVGIIVTRKRMVVVIIVLYVICFGLIAPFFFIYEIWWTPATPISPSLPNVRETKFFIQNKDPITVYNNIVVSNVIVFMPMVVVTVCTIMVVRKITSSMRWRHGAQRGDQAKTSTQPARDEVTTKTCEAADAPEDGSDAKTPRTSSGLRRGLSTLKVFRRRKLTNQRGDSSKAKNSGEESRKTTRMLIVIAITYILCNLPTSFATLASHIEPGFSSYGGRYGNSFFATFAFGILLQCVNSSINFLIYVANSSKIGEPFRKMLPCLFKVKE